MSPVHNIRVTCTDDQIRSPTKSGNETFYSVSPISNDEKKYLAP